MGILISGGGLRFASQVKINDKVKDIEIRIPSTSIFIKWLVGYEVEN